MIRRLAEQIIDLNTKTVRKIILKQGEDNGTVIPFRVIQGGLPFDLTGISINFVATKPDNTAIINTCSLIDPEQGKFEYLVTEQTVSVSGWMKADIQFIKAGSIAYSYSLTVAVEESALSPVISSPEYTALNEALERADQLEQEVADILNGAIATHTSNGLMSATDKQKLDEMIAITNKEIDAAIA